MKRVTTIWALLLACTLLLAATAATAAAGDLPCTYVFCEDDPSPQPTGPHDGMFDMWQCFFCHNHVPTGPQPLQARTGSKTLLMSASLVRK